MIDVTPSRTHETFKYRILILEDLMKKIYLICSILILLLFSTSVWFFLRSQTETQSMTYPDFLQSIENNQINKVTILEKSHTLETILDSNPDVTYSIPYPMTDDFIELLLQKNIIVSYDTSNSLPPSVQIFFLLALGSLLLFFYYKRKKEPFLQLKDANRKNGADSLSLHHVAGNEEAKAMAMDVISFLLEPEQYTSMGAHMPKGLLLYGPPGTGKTLLAKAIAGEANVPFYSMSGSDFVQMYVGVGASRIRNLFQKAKKSEKAVIFIDEIDAIGKKRGRDLSASSDERDQTLNALLTEMSGFHQNKGIVVIAATNRYEMLDEALLRPGRFDRQIEIGLPDKNARKRILFHYAKMRPLAPDVDLALLSESTLSFSGAMLENLLNEASILAAKEQSTSIQNKHIDLAFYTVLAGAPKTDRSYLSEKERKITAYHEAGHTLATKLLLPEHILSKVTILPSTKGAGGFHYSIPADTLYQTKRQLLSRIQVLLAGRAAEELIFGTSEITTGASNDIQKASSLIYHFFDSYGMDEELGLFSVSAMEEAPDSLLLSRCRKQMKQLYTDTLILLKENQSLLEALTETLLQKESLNEQDLKSFFASAACS